MAISKERKNELVAQYMDLLRRSDAIFITEYTGANVKTLEELRSKVYEAQGEYHVTKNTLLKHALKASDMPVPEKLMVGQVGTGFALGNAPALAKALVDFASTHDMIKLRGGVLGNKMLSEDDVQALAKLPSLDQLRAQLIGMINAPAQNLVGVIAGGVRQVINVIDAYAKSEDNAADANAGEVAQAVA